MKKIYTLHLEALKEKLFIAFIIFVLEAIEKFEVIGQMFAPLVARLKSAYDQMNRIFLKYDADFCTKEVQAADEARNIAIRKLRDTVKMFITFPETVEKTLAAEIVLKIIELYGGTRIPNQGMMAKTASIVNLIEDLEQKYPQEVETLGVGGLVEALKSAQAVFADKYMARAECESEIAKGAMAEARRWTSEAYRDLIATVNIAAKSDNEGQFTGFINLMNVEVGKYRTYTGQGQVCGNGSSGTGSLESEETEGSEGGSTGGEGTGGAGTGSGSGAGTGGAGTGSEEQEPTFTVTYIKGQYTWMTQQYAAGERIVPPAEPEAFRWVDVPEFMPDHDITIYAQYVG